MICQQIVITRADWSPATSYPFCLEHESLFDADDLNQCHAVRMAAALAPYGMKVGDFAGVTQEQVQVMEEESDR